MVERLQKIRRTLSNFTLQTHTSKINQKSAQERKKEFQMLASQFRVRINEMEKKKMEEKRAQLSKRRHTPYGEREIIKFPFLTFENDFYSAFMVDIMRSLEVRKYNHGFLTSEL